MFQAQFSNAYSKNMQQNVQLLHNNYYGGHPSLSHSDLSSYYCQNQQSAVPVRSQQGFVRGGKIMQQKNVRSNYQKSNGYQLKVGGVVVGNWANGSNRQNVRMLNYRPGMIRT